MSRKELSGLSIHNKLPLFCPSHQWWNVCCTSLTFRILGPEDLESGHEEGKATSSDVCKREKYRPTSFSPRVFVLSLNQNVTLPCLCLDILKAESSVREIVKTPLTPASPLQTQGASFLTGARKVTYQKEVYVCVCCVCWPPESVLSTSTIFTRWSNGTVRDPWSTSSFFALYSRDVSPSLICLFLSLLLLLLLFLTSNKLVFAVTPTPLLSPTSVASQPSSFWCKNTTYKFLVALLSLPPKRENYNSI